MSYTPTIWQDGDAITASKLNKIQEAVEARTVNPFLGSSFTAIQVKQILDLGMIPVITQDIGTNHGSNDRQEQEASREANPSTTLNQTLDYIVQFNEDGYIWITTIGGKEFTASSWDSPMTLIDDSGTMATVT